MRFRLSLLAAMVLPGLAGCGGDSGTSTSPSDALPRSTVSFFVTSSKSTTGNLGGLRGADAICQNLAGTVGLGGKNPNSVVFLGLNAVAWMPLAGQIWDFIELDGYETPIKDGRLNDVVSGDLNQDKRKDLVFLETAKNYLDLVIFDEENQLGVTRSS